jgi:hypothetical protein
VLAVEAAENFVEVTWRVRVPDFTPAEDVIVIAGNEREVFGGSWNPVQPMEQVDENVWEFTATVKEGTLLQYKYTRGSWDTVEQWGTVTGMANRAIEVVASPGGGMLIDNTATDWGEGPDEEKAVRNWRDPLVEEVTAGAEGVTVRFNSAVVPTVGEVITLVDGGENPVSGAVTRSDDRIFSFTADAPIPTGGYTVQVFNVETDVPMQRVYEAEVEIGG